MQNGNTRERFLTVREAAKIVPLSVGWYNKSRLSGDGPPFVRLSGRIFYPESQLVEWAKSHTVTSAGLATEAA